MSSNTALQEEYKNCHNNTRLIFTYFKRYDKDDAKSDI